MDTQDEAALAPSDPPRSAAEAHDNGMPYHSSQALVVGKELAEGSALVEAHPGGLPEGSISAAPPPDVPDNTTDLTEASNKTATDAAGSEAGVAADDDTATVEVVMNPGDAMANGENALQKEAIESDIMRNNVELQVQDIMQRAGQNDSIIKIEKMQDNKSQGESMPPEIDTIQVPQNWHFKPSVHVTIIGGEVNEEEMVTLFGAYGTISSISFESERRDSAIIRYDFSASDADKLVGQVREALNNTKMGDGTLIVEHFRSDSLLFVGNLTPDIDDTLLMKMFEPHGRVERAFVLRNSEGQSKGYGFVEYSLRGQASAAKATMGNINMDGRVLRVEWSDCRKVTDMFSTILFIDRIPRENPNVELSLRNLFGQYGKIRDCYLAVGIHQQFRGFGFIEFSHSIYADRAHHALDGYVLDGCSIRVSFGNPSKSVQSYKVRSGPGPTQFGPWHFKKGALDQSAQLEAPGMISSVPLKGSMGIPYLGSRYMAPVRPGMVGMGIGMQFGRGPLERSLMSPMLSSGAGMLGSGSVAAGMMGRAPLMVGSIPSRPYMGTLHLGGSGFQGLKASTSSTGVTQVANTQAKACEEEARARAEALKQGIQKVASQQQVVNQFRFNVAQQNIYQQQIPDNTDQHQRQTDSVSSYQQAYQQPSQQSTLQAQYQGWAQQQQSQAYGMQYYSQPTQNYSQLQGTSQQYLHQDGYYQQSIPQVQAPTTQQQYAYVPQYNTLYGQQYNQQSSQGYSQAYSQVPQGTEQHYQQPSQQSQQQTAYQQYADYYSVQASQDQTQMNGGVSEGNTSVAVTVTQDSSQQQQAYAAYYQQQAQIQSATSTATTGIANQQQSYEAQWAAYYANQAAYQQQASYSQQQSYATAAASTSSLYVQAAATDVTGQKRTAEQVESASQTQVAYNYVQLVPMASGDMQQTYPGMTSYQQQPVAGATAYQQQVVANYQQPVVAPLYQQPTSASAYQQTAVTNPTVGYDQIGQSATDGYQQQVAAAAGIHQTAIPGQVTVASVYDYSKRPRY